MTPTDRPYSPEPSHPREAGPSSQINRETLLAAIAKERGIIARLEDERYQAQERLSALEQQIQALESPHAAVPASLSNREKMAIFRRLFRGRTDVYPTRWEDPKNGKKGYSPVRQYGHLVPVDDQAFRDHLLGRRVVGVYPLLPDETCWFLAADFDKHAWADDVAAFRETCNSVGIPVAIERSRSGNGAHAWFFFAQPVSAATARKMGCYLLTETMARRHLGMASYDRLFPNQDTMPKGGFGNLIALPLQGGVRPQGHTEFLDDAMVPYPDQWAYLASIVPIALARVEALAGEAERRDRIIAVRLPVTDDNPTPWVRRPAVKHTALPGPLPTTLDAVLAGRLFIARQDLPSPLVSQLVRLAAFQNPAFYKKQANRLSTFDTPRVIACAEELSHHLALPRGCREDFEQLCHAHGITLRLEDQRTDGAPLDLAFDGTLTPIQQVAADALIAHDMGVFVAPPGIGKTIVGIYAIAQRNRNTLILVHNKPLLDQWRAQLARFLGLAPKAIGQIGGGKKKPGGRIDIAMFQTLAKANAQIPEGYGHVVVDECHHVPAGSFERVLQQLSPRFVTGLTATPYRKDGHQPIIHMQCGPIRFEVDARQQRAARPLTHHLVVRETAFRSPDLPSEGYFPALCTALASDPNRNAFIMADVERALAEGRSPIILTERKEHLAILAAHLGPRVTHLIVLQGGMKAKDRRDAVARLAAAPEGEPRLLLATGRFIGEGFDDSRLDTLFLTMPMSWKGTLVQYAGRLQRTHHGKTEVRIYDYADVSVPMLAAMHAKRLKGYRAIGYIPDARSSTESSQCLLFE
ncbi:MAG: putative helicase [Cyanobacteria bacterium RYN_339]|nr:putative helicase [Cyanobacteria bacterium RYN_339]